MKKETNDFLKTNFVFGVVLKASLDQIEEIKRYLAEDTDAFLIYQKISAGKLYIKENEEGGHDRIR